MNHTTASRYLVLPCAILVVAALAIRLAGTAWDDFAGLHPDERHMVFVVTDMMSAWRADAIASLSFYDLWFATGQSPLDPRSTGRSYVYGELPVIAVALLAKLTEASGWFDILALGRLVTTLVEASSVAAVFCLAQILYGKRAISLTAAALYAFAPTALQLTNFFAVDAWLMALFAWTAVVVASSLRAHTKRQLLAFQFVIGVCIGAATAIKVTGLALFLPAGLAIAYQLVTRDWRTSIVSTVVCIVAAALTFRFLNPFAFVGPGLFDVAPNPLVLNQFKALLASGASLDFPPNWQWIAGYSIPEYLRDFVLFGCGPVVSILLVWAMGGARSLKAPDVIVLLAFAVPLLTVSLVSFNPVLRYAAPVLPIIAVLAMAAVTHFSLLPLSALAAVAIWWGSGMILLHSSEHPRVVASKWLWKLPQGTVLANETQWDEALPVIVRLASDEPYRWPQHSNHFKFVDLDVTQPDTVPKARHIASSLAKSDYVIVSSGRQRDVLPRMRERFPLMTAYYRLLAADELCFRSVWLRDHGYPLPFFRLDDKWAQEPWRVYDHPIVEIYAKRNCFDEERTFQLLSSALKP